MEGEVEAGGVHHEGVVVHEVLGAEEPPGLAFRGDDLFKAFHGHVEIEFEPCAAKGPLVKPHATGLTVDPNRQHRVPIEGLVQPLVKDGDVFDVHAFQASAGSEQRTGEAGSEVALVDVRLKRGPHCRDHLRRGAQDVLARDVPVLATEAVQMLEDVGQVEIAAAFHLEVGAEVRPNHRIDPLAAAILRLVPPALEAAAKEVLFTLGVKGLRAALPVTDLAGSAAFATGQVGDRVVEVFVAAERPQRRNERTVGRDGQRESSALARTGRRGRQARS